MTEHEGGSGPLFTDPSPDRAREHFRGKRAGLVDRVMTVAVEVRRFVRDGDYLAVGGFGCDRIPAAALHEVVRGQYDSDEDHLRAWLAAERDGASHAAFLDVHLFGVVTFDGDVIGRAASRSVQEG